MSCSRLLYRLVRWARESSSLYGELKSQYTALSPRSWTRSSFLLSELLQKCHASPQYVKYGSMAALYILNLASTGINFRILISTPTRMLAFLPDADMCSVKDKSLSITTPSNSSSSVDLIKFDFKAISNRPCKLPIPRRFESAVVCTRGDLKSQQKSPEYTRLVALIWLAGSCWYASRFDSLVDFTPLFCWFLS